MEVCRQGSGYSADENVIVFYSAGAKFRTDANKFVVKDGKYFLFLNDLEVVAQQLWLDGDNGKLVAKADGNWTKLSKEQ